MHGKGRGRTVGMPTANIDRAEFGDRYSKPNTEFVGDSTKPKTESGGDLREGVYASVVHIGDEIFLGVTNIGHRPTVDEEKTIETHILDFDRDIYGEKIHVDLIEFLRGIQKFENLTEVKNQVEKDISRCREICNIITERCHPELVNSCHPELVSGSEEAHS